MLLLSVVLNLAWAPAVVSNILYAPAIIVGGYCFGRAVLEVQATKDFADNTILGIIYMVKEAQESRDQRMLRA